MNDVLAELRTELQGVTPSPEFTARVRERVASSSPAPRFGPWIVVVSAVGVIAAVALVPWTPDLPDTPPPAARIATATPPAPTASSPGAQETRAPIESGTVATPSARVSRSLRVARPQEADGRFEVITTQSAVLEQLWRHATATASDPLAAPSLPPPATVVDADGRLVVPELVIDPIVVPPIGMVPGGQGRVQRLVSPQATGSPR